MRVGGVGSGVLVMEVEFNRKVVEETEDIEFLLAGTDEV